MGFDPISIGLMVAGTAIAAVGQYQSMRSQQQQMKAKQAMNNMEAQQQRLEQVRQARIKQAQIAQMGTNQGAGESSSVTTGVSGVQGQAESNIQYIGSQQVESNRVVNAQQKEIQWNGVSQIGGDVFSAGQNLMNPDVQAGVKRTYNTVFGD